jgi:hypothetical protein
MKVWLLFVCLSLSLLPLRAAGAKKTGISFPARYEGGTLPLDQHKITATVAEDEMVFLHGHQRFAIPLKNITAISCGTDTRRRFGAVVLGVVPGMHLDKTEDHYVGVTWTDDVRGGSKIEAVLKLSNSEYRDFVAVLERLTGRKPVNTGKVPTIVRYDL